MGKLLIVAVLSAALLAATKPVSAQNVPGNCMVSFHVKPTKVTVDVAWTLAKSQSAVMSCGAAELLRQKLFIEGDKVLAEIDLTGSPADAQQKAVSAYNDLEKKIQGLPGEDVNGTLFTAGGYLISKYLLASCLLTAEAAGGTCWTAAIAFVTKTFGFFQKVQQDDKNKLKKQELLSSLREIRPALNAAKPGPLDQAGARLRWVQTQTNLCRAIQRDCL